MTFSQFLEDDGDDLDRKAFGFAVGDVLTLRPEQINVQYEDDLENPHMQIAKAGGPVVWAKSVSLRKPIDVRFKQGKFWIDDGHHRWTAAKILGKNLKCRVSAIEDNPVLALQNRINA